MPFAAEEVLSWHARADAFERLLPPWEAVELRSPAASLSGGARAELLMRIGPFWKR